MKKYSQIISFKIGLVFLLVYLGGASLAQSTVTNSYTYQPTADEIAKYGPGFPEYCSASFYSNRPECITVNGYLNDYMPPPLPDPDPCYLPGGYHSGCDYMPPPLPSPIDPCVTIALCYEDLPYQPQPQPLPPLPVPSVYDYRYDIAAPNCPYGYSPNCLAIATSKHFDPSYATSPTIPSYYLRAGQPEYLEYRINSPYHGYLYVFVTEPDQTTKLLYPNPYSSDAIEVGPGSPVDFPGANANYSIQLTEPYGRHKLFSIALSKLVPREVFQSIRTEHELNQILLELGLNQGIYHGYAETAFDVQYVIY